MRGSTYRSIVISLENLWSVFWKRGLLQEVVAYERFHIYKALQQQRCKTQLMECDSLGRAALHLSRYIGKHYVTQTSHEWTSVP